MTPYLELLRDIRANGIPRADRTGTGTISVFGRQIRFDLAAGFPAVTTKKLYIKGLIHELLWFLQGSSNIKYLVDHGVHIWNEWPYRAYLRQVGRDVPEPGSEPWNVGMKSFVERIRTDEAFAREHGNLGPVYGCQWRSWPTPDGGTIDQISRLVDQIRTDPQSRRLIVSAWNVADIENMERAGLPPCHCLFQFYVGQGRLSCQLYQRSGDAFLGVPFNIASYALLTLMLAQVTGLRPGEFVHTFGDAHVYLNHLPQVELQLSREPRPLPRMRLNPAVRAIFDFRYDDFTLENYDPHPSIAAPVAV